MKSFAKNDFFLGLVCAFLLILAYFVTRQDASALQKASQMRANLEDRRRLLTAYFQEMARIQSQSSPSDTAASLSNRSIATAESPNLSFAYFDKLARHLSASFDYRLRTDGEQQTNLLRENLYTMEGTGSFSDIHHFLNALEKGRTYYRIRRLQVRSMNNLLEAISTDEHAKEVAFTLEASGYSMPGSADEPSFSTADVEMNSPHCALFSPPRALVSEVGQSEAEGDMSGLSVNELPRLSSQATLVAISGSVAYVRDDHGNLIALREGDRVFEGEVGQVNVQEGFMEIIPYDGGERLVLRVGTIEVGGK